MSDWITITNSSSTDFTIIVDASNGSTTYCDPDPSSLMEKEFEELMNKFLDDQDPAGGYVEDREFSDEAIRSLMS